MFSIHGALDVVRHDVSRICSPELWRIALESACFVVASEARSLANVKALSLERLRYKPVRSRWLDQARSRKKVRQGRDAMGSKDRRGAGQDTVHVLRVGQPG